MSSGRTVALFVVGLVLSGTLLGGAVAIGAERTAFDSAYASETFETEGVYAEITQTIREDVADDIDEILDEKPIPRGIRLTIGGEEIARQGVTEGLVGETMDRTLGELYRYLHGDRENLDITIELTAVKSSVSETITDGIEVDTPTLVGSKSDRLDEERIAKLRESQSAYQEAQLDVSPQERTALAAELEQTVRVELRDEDEALTDAVLGHQQTVLDGLTGEVSYEEYVEQVSADEQRIKEAVAASAVADVPKQESAFAENDDPEAAFGPFRSAFRWGSTAAWLLPLCSVGLIGLGYGLTRSVDRTAAMTAGAMGVAGFGGVILGVGGRALLLDMLKPDDPSPIFDGLAGVIEGTMRTITLESVLLLLAGCGLLAVVYADRQGKLESVRAAVGVEPRTNREAEGDDEAHEAEPGADGSDSNENERA